MNDSSKDESFYITQTSTRMEGETTEIDEHWFDIDHSSRRTQLQDVKTIEKPKMQWPPRVSISLEVGYSILQSIQIFVLYL